MYRILNEHSLNDELNQKMANILLYIHHNCILQGKWIPHFNDISGNLIANSTAIKKCI